MNRSIIISSVLHATLIFITALSLPFLAKKPLDIPPIVSVELIQIAEKTNIPFAPKAKKIIEKIKEGKTIVFPKMGIGTGLAQLDMRAPKTFKYLVNLLRALRDYINSFQEVDGKYKIIGSDLPDNIEVEVHFEEIQKQIIEQI